MRISRFHVSLAAILFISINAFADISTKYFPSNIISDWNAVNVQDNQVFDYIGQNTGILNGVTPYWDGIGQIFLFNNIGNNISVVDSQNLNPTNEFTVMAWIRTNNNSLGTQSLISKLQRNSSMSSNNIISYDATDAGGSNINSGNYTKPSFDGRYIYSISIPRSGFTSRVIRYDTYNGFNNPASWAGFTPYQLRKSNDNHWYSGYSTSVYDGRYLYFVPQYFENEPGRMHGFTLRYDTQGQLDSASSWKSFDIKSLDGMNDLVFFRDGLFDGRYVYFVGGGTKPSVGQKVARYDTTLSFDNASAWSYVAVSALVSNIGTSIYSSSIQAGNYIYLIPSSGGKFVRYDIQKSFTDPASWSTFDASNTNGSNASFNYNGGTFDGRFIYFSPSTEYSENLLRYDTTQDFTLPSAWSAYSVKEPITGQTRWRKKSYEGVGFDGRYVYFLPYYYLEYDPRFNRIWSYFGGSILRYDTTQPFTLKTSWSELAMSKVYGAKASIFDQRHLYIMGVNGYNFRAVMFRFDTAADNNYAFSLNRSNSLNDSASNFSTGPSFSISTSNGYFALNSTAAINNGWHLLTGVYDGSNMSIYLDANIIAARPASGTLNTSPANLLIGASFNNSFNYIGDLNKAEIYSRALSQTEIQKALQLSPYGSCGLNSANVCRMR
ncbi:MAG: hypothetical protein ACD_46C00544G0002 [uncultured bacterium]|nr:MAG: hypothetical protein ACD_46C00544G0002 [uncultured bacterium]